MLTAQVIDLTDPGFLLPPPRVRQRTLAAAQDTVEIVGEVRGGDARQQGNQPGLRVVAAPQPAAPRAPGADVLILGGLGLGVPGVTLQSHTADKTSPARKNAAKAPAAPPADDSDVAKCALCLEALKEDLCINPTCGHVFHFSCMNASLAKFKQCPRCRKKISGAKALKRIYM
jgi:hypothetical protein